MAETRATWGDLIEGVGLEILEVFDQAQEEYIPGIGNVLQTATGSGAQETFSGKVGAGELSKFNDGSPIDNKNRYRSYDTTIAWINYGGVIDVTKNTIEDRSPEFSAQLDEMKDLSIGANFSQDKSGMQLFNGGFATTVAVNGYDMTWYGDGVALYSNSHPTLVPGASVNDNLGTAATFNHTNLETGLVALIEQKTDDGLPLSLLGKATIVLPPALRKEGLEITDSELDPETANNAINVYRNGMPADMITSTHLANTFGGSDTAWFLTVPQRAKLFHIVRQGPRLEHDIDIKSKVVTFTVDARWADGVKDWRRTWGNAGS